LCSNRTGDWGGWGYRHIAAKHGWTSAEVTATREALLSGTTTPDPIRGVDRWIYRGPEYLGRNGVRCQRVVVVDFGTTDREEAVGVGPASIVTSFGGRIA
jgi:hypothetical protein